MVLSGVQFVVILTFINLKHWIFRWANNVLVSAWIVLLWRFVLRLFICLFLQHECRCRHVSFGGSCVVVSFVWGNILFEDVFLAIVT